MRRDSPLTSPRGRASGYRVVVEQSRQLATGWMVGSSPRCADSFSPTKSRKRLSDASLEPNWRILVHPSQGLESFFFFFLRLFLDCSRVSQCDPCPQFRLWNPSREGIPAEWGEVPFVVDHPLSRRCGKGFILNYSSSFDIENMVCAH